MLLIGPRGIGPWQEIEYYTAFDRHVQDARFVLVTVIASANQAPGLPFLRNLTWIETTTLPADEIPNRVLAAMRRETTVTSETVAGTAPLWKLVNPYRGLEAMTEANADYFHGRTAETAGVLATLAEQPGRCPILIGASGVGKSSVAQAGVLSALKSMRWPRADGAPETPWPAALQGSRSWALLTARPGETPLETLVAAFTRLWQLDPKDPDQAALPRKWVERLSAGENELADLVGATQEEIRQREGEAPARLLLYLDQGEELYARAAPTQSRRFSELLSEGLADPRLLAFASLRADYFDKLQADEALFRCHAHINVPPLDRTQLHTVVTAPAAALGVGFEDDQVAIRITDAAAAAPGALPLLSYLLTDMWSAMITRGDAQLRLPAQAIDVGGVLAARAEEFLKTNPDEEAALRRLLTLKLAVVPPEGEPVRRPTYREECSDTEWSLAARLADHPWRLVVMGDHQSDGRIVAEVAREALLRAWPRLAAWLRDEREFLVFKSEVERAQRRWRDMGSDKALLVGLDLARAEEWLPKRGEDLSTDVRAFIQASITADRATKERQLRFQRRVTAGAIAAALIMTVIGGIAWHQWSEAVAQRILAQRSESLFRAEQARRAAAAGDAVAAVLLAVEGLPDAHSDDALQTGRPYMVEAEQALFSAWQSWRERALLTGHKSWLAGAVFSPDGRRVLTASADRTARLWDARTGQPLAVLSGHEDALNGAVFSPDGRHIVTASRDNTARLWDADTAKPMAVLSGHTDWVNGAAFSPDGRLVLTHSRDATARLWTLAGELVATLEGHEGEILSAAFSSDGRRIVTGASDNTARLWDAANGRLLATLSGHESWVVSVAFSPAPFSNTAAAMIPPGRRIVTGSSDNSARLWDADTGRLVGTLAGHTDRVIAVAFSPDGRRVLTASSDKTTRLWDAETAASVAILAGHDGVLRSAVFAPDGRILTASEDKTARLWTADGVPLATLSGHQEWVLSAAFSPDGRRVLTASVDRTARLWGMDGAALALPSQIAATHNAAFSPDGRRVVTASEKIARIWDVETAAPLASFTSDHDAEVDCAAFSPDGSRIVTGARDGNARVWDAASGTLIAGLAGHTGAVVRAAFSPDGRRVLTASQDATARLWETETGKLVAVLAGHQRPLTGASFSPDGSRILTAAEDDAARLWNADGRVLAILEAHAREAAFSPDGRRILTANRILTVPALSTTASTNATARLWSADGKLLATLTDEDGAINAAAFTPDGRRILTALNMARDRAPRLWDVETATPLGLLAGPAQDVNSAAFSPDGRRVVIGSGTLPALWDGAAGTLLAVFSGHEFLVGGILFASDGGHILTVSWDKTARLWDVFPDTQSFVDHVKRVVPRCLTREQRRNFQLAAEPPSWCQSKWPYAP